MNKKDVAYRIALKHIALAPETKTDPAEDKTKTKTIEFPEKKIRELSKNELTRNYPATLGSFFRGLDDIVQVISAANYAIKFYSKSTVPRENLVSQLSSMKSKVLSLLYSIALLEKNSLIDEVVDIMKKNPEDIDEDTLDLDVQEQVRKILRGIKEETRSYLRRITKL